MVRAQLNGQAPPASEVDGGAEEPANPGVVSASKLRRVLERGAASSMQFGFGAEGHRSQAPVGVDVVVPYSEGTERRSAIP